MSARKLKKVRPPRVFISYSHGPREHNDRVLELAQQLRRDGIDAELDQFHQHELAHWPRWCEEQLRPENSDFVLCICTLEYKRRIEGQEEVDVGKGVFWEGTLIYNYLYNDKTNRRFVPILLDRAAESAIPSLLGGYTRFYLNVFDLSDPESDYAWLYRMLTGQGGVQGADLGGIIKLLPLAGGLRQTDFTELVEKILTGIAQVKEETLKIHDGMNDLKNETEDILSILKDRVPMPSTPDRPHNLPPWMDPAHFIGRDKELMTLRDGLTAPGGRAMAVVQPHVLRGGGGVGKTRLAIQAVWVLYLQDGCDMAFHVSASSLNELAMQLAALDESSLLNLYGQGETPTGLETRRDNVVHALRRRAGRWVLVIDGADSVETRDATNKLISELAGGRFVITSRRDDWPIGIVRRLPLDLFTPEEARACLVSRYWKEKPSPRELADFDRVAEELGRLPLALALAASYMESRRIAPGRYLAEWKEKREKLLDFSAADVDYPRSLLTAFKISFDRLGPPASALLSRLAWLAPEPFPRAIMEDSEEVQAILSAASGGPDQADAGEALAELQTLSLVELDEDSLQLHKLVLECSREVLPQKARRESLKLALSWLCSKLPTPEYDKAGWDIWTRLSPHLDAIVEAAKEGGLQDETLGRLCNNYGLWLYYQARHISAEPMMRRALQIYEQSFGPDHPKVATILNNLAQLLKATNRLSEAEPMMQRALKIDEQSFGPDHPEVATDLNNLAQLLTATNRLSEAEPMMRRTLRIDELSFGPDHPEVASALNNLAQLLKATNRLSEAEPMMRRALKIDEKSFGPDHPEVATALNNLALLLKATNRLAEAEPMMRRALKIVEKIFGQDHPQVAIRLNSLAQLLKATNRLSEAEPMMRRALTIAEQSFGPDHPNVAICLNNLAQLLSVTNRLSEAEPMMWRALQIDEQSFGPDHPKVATDLNNLAQLFSYTNRLPEAEPIMRRALKICEQSFGQDHPKVATAINNLAQLLTATNRFSEAEPMMRRALKIAEKSFGPDHPEVARDLNNLASLLLYTNRLSEAEPMMRRALKIAEKSFGPDHPEVATDLNNLAQLLKDTNRLSEAEPIMRRALKIYEESFGPDHPNVAAALNNLAQLLSATNRLSEAEPMMRRALQIDELSFGPDHPNVAIRLNNLAQLLKDTNRLSEAEPMMRRALKITEQSFGPNHPEVAKALNNLAQLLEAKGRPADNFGNRGGT
ncbi:MAG: tetratricopeptide repeat protein [Syntrophobacteraceae bacterium]